MAVTDILKDFDDLTEPACMDKILMYLEELKEEDDAFMELLVEKLAREEITWEQPWYQQTNSVSRPLKENNEKHKETYKTDTICKAENDIIIKNWKDFIHEYDVPDKIICLARWKNKVKSRLPNTPEESARRFLISYLARGLQRTTFQVFRHIQTYFGGPVKGAYSAEEEKIMNVCFTHHPNHAVTLLSMVLGREPRGIYKRLQQLYNGKPERKKIRWTIPVASKLLKLLMKYTGLPLEELKNKRFDKEVWVKIAEEFDHHYIHIQKFWYSSLHVQLFVKSNVKLNKLRKKIFKKLKLTSYQIWSDIRWKDVVQQFPDEYTHYFIYKISYGPIHTKPKYHKEPLPEVLDYGLKRLKHYRKLRLRTLALNKEGDLEQVIYDKSNNKS
ncbi:unnamed protein product [Arctia plantaginis]|uniref:Uncharacterized protein n=1 Tax=Arctia plantaginis TaxID=874455 RepID=A0A8S0ZZX6_ARCPL|nr:unnamed protein product [Arctia plantaginis]